MRWQGVLALAVSGMIAGGPVGAQVAAQDIADLLADAQAIPGSVAGRVTADTLEVAVAGMRALNGDDPVLLSDAWHVGSLTKSMTATLAARLVEADLIEWGSRVGSILAADYPDMRADWHEITLRQLLSHASGMDANLGRARSILLGDGPRSEYVRQMLASRPVEAPGGFAYSNAGYVVAGTMLEAVSGESWEALITREVFEPLGMENAGFGPPQGAAPIGHRRGLLGRLRTAGQGAAADNISAMGPAGRVHLSGADMLRYLRAHLVRDTDFLSLESWQALHRASGPEDYALGWGVSADGHLRHAGSNTLWFAVASIDRESGDAAFIAVNSGDLRRVREPVEDALSALLASGSD